MTIYKWKYVDQVKTIYRTIIILALCSGLSYSQTRSNLETINSLIDMSADSISEKIAVSDKSYSVSFNSTGDYVFLQNRLIARLSATINLNIDSLNNNHLVKYNLDFAGIKYSDTFKDGLFGDFRLQRTAELKGSFQVVDEKRISHSQMIEYSAVDTISYDDLQFVEQPGLSFTKAPLPPEPFLPTLVEPLIAISAVVITVILFFTVRTK